MVDLSTFVFPPKVAFPDVKKLENTFDEGCEALFVGCVSATFENAKRYSALMESVQNFSFFAPLPNGGRRNPD